MLAVVLAGGLGTRMGAATADLPKVLLDIHGRPFLDLLIERLSEAGFTRVLVCAGHLADAVEAAAARLGPVPEVRVVRDGPTLLGTAGALRAAAPWLEPAFLVTYGDSYLTFDYAAPLRALESDPTALGCMAVYENRGAIEPSNAAVAGGRVVRYDKARAPGAPSLDHIDYGATALRLDAMLALEPGMAVGLDQVQATLAERGQLLAHVATERFYEIGSPAGLDALRAHLGPKTSC